MPAVVVVPPPPPPPGITTPSPTPVIHPPCTLTDDGSASESILVDAKRVFDLIQDERHLTAETLLRSVRERLAMWDTTTTVVHGNPNSNLIQKKKNGVRVVNKKRYSWTYASQQDSMSGIDGTEINEVQMLLASKENEIYKLEHRCRIFRRAQQNLDGENEAWMFASKHFGVTTYYRKESDDSLTVKIEGELKDFPLFEQLCVLKEVDLHHHWAPFCTSSLTIAELDKLDLVGWFVIGLPGFGLARDGCFRAIGCDNMKEDGTILLAGQGVRDIKPGHSPPDDDFLSSDPALDRINIPPVPKTRGCGRMTIRKFEAVIRVTSATSAHTKVVANINPNFSFLPQTLLDFIMKQVAGLVLAKLQHASKKAASYPVRNVHAVKIREKRDLYEGWILPKFIHICAEKGWPIPHVAALEVDKDQVQHERNVHPLKRAQTFNGTSQERIVENISQVRSSNTTDEVNSRSELSSLSGGLSLWSRNPIATYLRGTEIKHQYRKAEELAETRRMSAALLVPKELRASDKERLEELRLAKYQRLGQVPTMESIVVSNNYPERLPMSQILSRSLHRHGPYTRIAFMTGLVLFLFFMLHHEAFLKYIFYVRWWWDSTQIAWLTVLIQNIAVIVYIFACAVPHYLVCDVALVYVFDTLELGSKTGVQVKKFYRENVHYLVAAGSLGIVAVSIFKAAVKVWIRCLLWCTMKSYNIIYEYVFVRLWWALANVIPEQATNVCAVVLQPIQFITSYTLAVISYVLGVPVQGLLQFVIQSNFIGRTVEAMYQTLVGLCAFFYGQSTGFILNSIQAFEGKATIASWRVDAFNTARFLFSYSAVFLLTLLILFSASARSAIIANSTLSRRSCLLTEMSSMSEESSSSSHDITSTRMIKSSSRGVGLQVTPIAEDRVLEDKITEQRPFVPDSDSSTSTRRRRFSLRRCRTSISNNNEKATPGIPEQGHMLAKSSTF